MSNDTVVLLGDSILDNAPYTDPEPDTTTHLARMLGAGWSVARLATDGAVIADIERQLSRMSGRASVAVLSVGGNDATAHIGLLDEAASSAAAVLDRLMTITDDFAHAYGEVARAVAARADRTILCTIYEAQLEPARHARLARAPLGLLNDQILRLGTALGADILELRSICTEPDDFVLEIEPSATGAKKIAAAIAAAVDDGHRPLESGRVFSA